MKYSPSVTLILLTIFFEHHLKSNQDLRNTCYNYADELANSGWIDDLSENDMIDFCQKLLDEFEVAIGKKIIYWLCLCDKKEDVYEYDIHDELRDSNIDEYEESEVTLSDIGSEGKLCGYEVYPVPKTKK